MHNHAFLSEVPHAFIYPTQLEVPTLFKELDGHLPRSKWQPWFTSLVKDQGAQPFPLRLITDRHPPLSLGAWPDSSRQWMKFSQR